MALSITLSAVAARIGESITITGIQDTPTVPVISTLTHTDNIVTVTTTTVHGAIVGSSITIAGTTVSGYHGTFTITNVLSATVFTYALVGSLADGTGGTASYNQVFNIPHNKNVVTFNDVVADIVSGTETSLIVVVPQLADNGYVVVETFLDVDNTDQRATSPQEFTIQYDDDAFPDNVSTPDPYHKGYINNRIKTLNTDPSNTATYNRDFSYSKYIEIVDENSMVQNFMSLILTGKLERMWEPDFGSTIPELPFQLLDNPEQLELEILNEAERLIKEHEPRITLIKSQSIVNVDPDTNRVDAVFAIQVPTGTVREIGVTLGQVQNETM